MASANTLRVLDVSDDGAAATQALHDDIRATWSKFSDFEVGMLKDNDDLVTQVADRYTLDHDQARSDVATLLKGRTI